MEDFIRDVIFPCLYHDFYQICEAAILFLTRVKVDQWNSLFKSLSHANLNTLARQNKTEGEGHGALRFLAVYSRATLADPELLVRFIRGLFTMTFESE